MWSQITNVTDRRTDRRTTCNRKTALCTKVHCAVKKIPTAFRPVQVFLSAIIFCVLLWNYSLWWFSLVCWFDMDRSGDVLAKPYSSFKMTSLSSRDPRTWTEVNMTSSLEETFAVIRRTLKHASEFRRVKLQKKRLFCRRRFPVALKLCQSTG